MLTARTEVTDQMLTFGQRHLQATFINGNSSNGRREPRTGSRPKDLDPQVLTIALTGLFRLAYVL